MMGAINAMVLDQAVNAYEGGGSAKLSAYLDSARPYLRGRRYVTDASGKDLLTGANRSARLKSAKGEWGSALFQRRHDCRSEIG
jgi:hypothetical protein